MSSFDSFNLPKSIKKAIDELGYTTPTPIQLKSFKPISSGRDIIGIAPTGTGKTLAYLLPLLKEYKYSTTDSPKIVILVPTRELVIQITQVLEELTQYLTVRILGIYGGVNINTQRKKAAEGVDILVGTPGRTMDLALDNNISFSDLKKLVIDEFDEVLELGFKHQLTSIFTMMKEKKQTILFSATMTDGVDELINHYFKSPVEVSLVKPGSTIDNITQIPYFVPNFLTKINYLVELLKQDESYNKVIIFVNTKRQVELLTEEIEKQFPDEFGVIHSNKSQNYRIKTVESFINNELRGIITTDIMARGLDINEVSHVINVEIPENPQQYVHRIGRTGRADQKGNAVSFVSMREQEYFIDAQILMDIELDLLDFPYEAQIIHQLMRWEKDKAPKVRVNQNRQSKDEKGEAFHSKKKKNSKINLGGPTKRKPPKTKPKNRGAEKRKKKRK